MKWPDALQEIIDEFKEIEDQFEAAVSVIQGLPKGGTILICNKK